MSNKEILSQIKRLVKLMELHGENDFKIRSFQNAVQRLERVNEELASMTSDDLLAIDGVGKSVTAAVDEIITSGKLESVQELEMNTPAGLLELLQFRGIGTKKLRLLWQDFGVADKNGLKDLVASGQLLAVKGFGAKTVSSLGDIVDFAFESEGKVYYVEAEKIGKELINEIVAKLPESNISFVGKLRRKWETIDNIEVLIDQPLPKLLPILNQIDFITQDKKKSGPFSWKGFTTSGPSVAITIYPTSTKRFSLDMFLKTGSPEHINSEIGDKKLIQVAKEIDFSEETDIYSAAGMVYCEPEIREGSWEIETAIAGKLPDLLKLEDLKGILHNHTNYSDGQHSLAQMSTACLELGYEYVGISDHSKAASFYANGLFEERVFQQQEEIDFLNKQLKPFQVFKGIEADILSDGALDYDNETLSSFDFVVASIHSGLSMDKTRATERLITAIANPFTTILGHMTGRILLQRIGYPVDHQAIINACAEFGVVIEINAHPKRLDIDWRWVHKALDKGVMLSINPDAHEILGYHDMYYGVCVGRKGGLTKEQTLNAMGLAEISTYFENRKQAALKQVKSS